VKEQVAVLQLVNQFAIGGAECQFMARLRGHPRDFRPVVACINQVGPHLEGVRKLGLPIEEFGLKGTLKQLNTATQILKLAAFIEREKIKLIHANDFYTNLLAVPAARLVGVKVICSRFDLAHWHSRAQHLMEALVSRAADAVFTNADAVRDLCIGAEGIPEERVVVVRNGLDLPEFDAALRAPLQGEVLGPQGPVQLNEPGREGRPTVMAIGNLHPVKGHLDLIEAVERLRKRMPDLLVLCAGEGPMRASLEQQIAERGLRDCVLLLGHRADVPALLARSQVGVLASHAEGLSNALIEAMAASLPVVATAVGGTMELVTQHGPSANGCLVPPYKSEALADKLEELLLDAERRKAYGKAARLRVLGELNLSEMTRRTGELYQRVLSGKLRHEAAFADLPPLPAPPSVQGKRKPDPAPAEAR